MLLDVLETLVLLNDERELCEDSTNSCSCPSRYSMELEELSSSTISQSPVPQIELIVAMTFNSGQSLQGDGALLP